MTRATKLVCTMGPASEGLAAELVAAGMDVARVNCSHGRVEDHERMVGAVRAGAEETGRPVGVLADLSGPKVRLGALAGGGAVLPEGAPFVLRPDGGPGDAAGAAVSYPGLVGELEPGDRVLLSDGAVELRVDSGGDVLLTTVVRGGAIRSGAGLNAPSERLGLPAVTDKDRADAAWAVSADVDLVAQSFVRRAEDVAALREIVGPDGPPLVAKIETRAAVEDIDRILEAADGIMVARGDLGVETPLEEIPVVQRDLVDRAGREAVPVIVATQMLESMIHAARPTRAEATDVAGAVFEGADAVMLSGETAIGDHPVEAAATAARIAEIAETKGRRFLPAHRDRPVRSDAHAVAEAAAGVALGGGAVAIACLTRTGRTAELLSAARPGVPILALSPFTRVLGALAVRHGVTPHHSPAPESADDALHLMERGLQDAGLCAPGDPAVLVSSTPFGAPTNLLKVHRVGW